MDLNSIFNNLRQNISPDGNEEYNFMAEPIEGTHHKLGVSQEGYPKFFIYTNDAGKTTPPTRLQYIMVEYNIPCRLLDQEGNIDEKHNYTVLTLTNDNDSMQRNFIDIVAMLLEKMSSTPTRREIAVEVENLVTIFSTLNTPSTKSVQGLWAELLVIETSLYPQTLINAWHVNPNEKYDFTLGADKIEVKSTRGETRKHHFTLDQLSPTRNSRLLIASVIARESGKCDNGLSVNDLRDRIFGRVGDAALKVKIYQVIANTLGNNVEQAENEHFDYIGAKDSLRYYDFRDVHGAGMKNDDSHVSSINFDSDLTGLPDADSTESQFDATDSPLFKSIKQWIEKN